MKTVPEVERDLAAAYQDLEWLRNQLKEFIYQAETVPEPYSTYMYRYIPRIENNIKNAEAHLNNLLELLKEVVGCQGRQLGLFSDSKIKIKE
jgi:hypothetical protein